MGDHLGSEPDDGLYVDFRGSLANLRAAAEVADAKREEYERLAQDAANNGLPKVQADYLLISAQFSNASAELNGRAIEVAAAGALTTAIEDNTEAVNSASQKADHFATVLLIVGFMTLGVALIQLVAMVS